MFLWGFCLRIVYGLHCTWLINSATHIFGKRRFETEDDSRNSFILAVLTFGDSAPASGISVGLFFYSSGLVFGVSAAVILLLDLVRVLSGQATEEDLISVKEGE